MMKTYDDYFDEGLDNYNLGEFEAAIISFDKCIAISPDSDAYTNRGLMKYELNDYVSAIDDYNRAIKLDKINVHAYFNRGLAYKQLEKFKEALDDFRVVKANNKNYDRIDFEIEDTNSYLESTNPKQIQSDQDSAINFYKLAQISRNNKEFKKAILYLDAAIQIDRANADFLYERGICKSAIGDFTGSILDLTKSFELNPKNHLPIRERAIVQFQLGSVKGAIEDLDVCIKISNDIPDLYYNRGIMKLNCGDEDGIEDIKIAARNGHIEAIEILNKLFPERNISNLEGD